MAVVADDTRTVDDPVELDPEADHESRRRARVWLWVLVGLVIVAIAVVSFIGRQQETSVTPAPKPFCKAAKAYENDIDRYGANYKEKVALQIERWELLAETAPKSVRADAEMVLATLRAYQAAPNQRAREALQDDPEVKRATDNVTRRWNQGCDVFARDSIL
jgi:hypothetical protein